VRATCSSPNASRWAKWRLQPPGEGSSAACRGLDCAGGQGSPVRCFRSSRTSTTTRKGLVKPVPSLLTPPRDLTQGAERLQSP